MGRSLQFRVYEHQLFALFRLAFAPAPHFLLNLAGARNSLAHSSIGTPSLALRLLVDIRFQVLFHSAPAVLFTFPSRYYALSVTKKCLALEVVPRLPTKFLVLRGTLDPCPLVLPFTYAALTLSGLPFQVIRLGRTRLMQVRNPNHPKMTGLGSALFARRYCGHLV